MRGHERFCWESFGSFGHQNLLRALDGDISIKNLALYIQVAKCYVNFPATTAKVKANCGKCWSLMCSKTCIIHAREPLLNCDFSFCVTRASLLYFIRSWVALSFLCESVSQSGIGNTCPDLHFLQYIKACMPSTDTVSSITNCYGLIVSYSDPVHSFIIS